MSERVRAVLSTGRLGFSDNHNCAMIAFSQNDVSMGEYIGVFWEQHLERALTHMVEETDAELVFTTDNDTLFDHKDVSNLIRLMDEHKEADAICAVQMRRNYDMVLLREPEATKAGVQEADYSGELTRIISAHFGLTIFRIASLRDLTHPWLISLPDEDGRWGARRQDADIVFWHNWENAGKTLFQANKVRIGHMQLMATWADEDFKSRYQYMNDYRASGKPRDIAALCY